MDYYDPDNTRTTDLYSDDKIENEIGPYSGKIINNNDSIKTRRLVNNTPFHESSAQEIAYTKH